MSKIKAIEITLLGKSFNMACPENQEHALYSAAEYLNHKMREIQETGRVVGLERIAVLAAINMAHDHLSTRSITQDYSDAASEKVEKLQNKIDAILELAEYSSYQG